ncbi:MAG: hypothetical protein U9R79_14870 [Armatimonadota bacterium]|nr:hypothetical protein [Armatimonadota bacterium]
MMRPSMYVCCALLLVTAGCAVAQSGTPNWASAHPWHGESIEAAGQVRVWEGDGNETVSVGVRGAMGENADARVQYFVMDTEGDDPINASLRRSKLGVLAFTFTWPVTEGDYMVSVQPGFEFITAGMRGTSAVTGQSAVSDDVVTTLAVPVELAWSDSTRLIVGPKAACYGSTARTTFGTSIDSFGTIVALGGGVVHDFGTWELFGDAAAVVEGNNTINETTNLVDDDFVWSAGARWQTGGPEDWVVDLFATNAAGPTAATSLLAAPDQSVGVGLRVGRAF